MLIWPASCTVLLGAVVGYAAFFQGGVVPEQWNVCLLAIGILSVVYWVTLRKTQGAPGLEKWFLWPAILLPLYLAFELIPFPLSVLRVLSPSRAELLLSLQPILPDAHFAPLSVMPPAAVTQLFAMLANIAIFLLVRELAFRWHGKRWAMVMPLLLIGAFEAGLGMLQAATDLGNANARGTYINRDHFAGLIEMIFPFAVMYGIAVLRRTNSRYSSPARPAVIACLLFSTAALLLISIVYSLSRMGFLVALASLFVMASLTAGSSLPSRHARRIALGLIALAILLVFVFLPPDQLIARFADIASTDKVSGDTRLHLWKQSLSLIAAYPLFGCGLGGYESAFRKFQVTESMYSIDYAHNDYLQFLAELGIFGFLIIAVFVAGIVMKAVKAFASEQDVDGRCLAIACVASLVAILLHSLVDFNLQVPANALTFAWICGITAALYFRTPRDTT